MSVVAEAVDNRFRVDKLFDINLLAKHITDGVVRKQTHPTLPLSIFSYTEKAQYGGIWDEVTNECRGLIVDDAGYVVARPFRKFHNLNTRSVPETLEANLPDSAPEVTQKLDGSLGILWRYSGEYGIATRGSFTSEQSQWATRWYKQHVEKMNREVGWADISTPLFEIIYPENRIVCNYDFEGLVLLALVDNRTGAEAQRWVTYEVGTSNGLRVVQSFKKSLAECVAENNPNEEGYVLTWRNQGKPPLKVKVKFADYVRLHRVVTGLNPKDVWEMLAQQKAPELFALLNDETMPQHFRGWLSMWIEVLTKQYGALLSEADFICRMSRRLFGFNGTRKDYALFFQEQAKDKRLLPILFQMLDHPLATPHPEVQKAVWKQVKPSGATTTFRKDGE